MRKIIYCLICITVLISCKKEENKTVAQNPRTELIPEPDQTERLKYEAILKLKKSNCLLDEPDISVNGIEIRNFESAKKVIEDKDKIDELGQYHFYSNREDETLTLIQHPGDSKYQISIFKIENSTKESLNYRKIKADAFKTGKGIKLGMSKNDIVKILGKCYAPIDSTKGYIELYYTIELPNDSKSKLLEKNNMPSYYASYKLWNNKLQKFEFGFEYP
ncbi:hypothetical protein [Flavobacterium reichenbachii]|uniref:Lipoprotein n=1 Tax=Flavobacterium reichenbachii TaxID=362418 RepID=A0A085ZGH5_9FLAO|nr:hypothetical protein [Flavobacterium reichenbachii]KFF03539.1 hypothetical protein IW19_21930 [Flavobacterium reichenbachii]OXB15643.1 hypothetical protein B0A68_09615 [Flavobacterium reichenbachii]